MPIDLHTHSTASDGTVLPAQLPGLAAKIGLNALALTDHDTVAGLPDFLAEQTNYPQLELIPGIELSSRYGNREIHFTGLFIDPEDAMLLELIQKMRRARELRGNAMREKLADLGYPLNDEDLLKAGADLKAPGRPHFARAIMDRYDFKNMADVFARLLKRGASAYVPRDLPDPREAVAAIKHARGTAVWAHPIHSGGGEIGFARRLIQHLKPAGLDAMEAFYTDFTPEQTMQAQRIAAEHHLVLSGGSDFHGDNHPDVKLGSGRGNLCVPDELLAPLKKAKEDKVTIQSAFPN